MKTLDQVGKDRKDKTTIQDPCGSKRFGRGYVSRVRFVVQESSVVSRTGCTYESQLKELKINRDCLVYKRFKNLNDALLVIIGHSIKDNHPIFKQLVSFS